MRRMVIVAFCGLLLGCASVPREGCLPMKVYTAGEQEALANALAVLPPESPLVHAMEDYGALRDANRACSK